MEISNFGNLSLIIVVKCASAHVGVTFLLGWFIGCIDISRHNAITHAAMQNLDKQIWKSRITVPTKLKLYNTCILPIFLYGSECCAVTKRDVLKIDVLDQWCLRKLLGIKWYHHVRNDEGRRITGQPCLLAIVQARRLSLFGHIARMPDETDARSIITASPSEN